MIFTGFWVQELENGDAKLLFYNHKGEEVDYMYIPKASRSLVAESLLPVGSVIIYPNGRKS